jgi:undecaprenyl-diphosphatase
MSRIQALDDRLLRSLVRTRRSPATFALRTLCRLYDPDSIAMLIVVLVFCGPLAIAISEMAVFALVATSIVVVAVKRTVRRTRPADEVQATAPPDRFSFPSGHTAASFALAIAMFAVSPVLVPPLVVLAVLTGYARMYLGVHYPIDVLGGAFVGVFVGSLVAVIGPVYLTPLLPYLPFL